MIYRGHVRITARVTGGCGSCDLDRVQDYCIAVADISEVKKKVEEQFGGTAQAWHDGTGCDCDGIVETVFHWDE